MESRSTFVEVCHYIFVCRGYCAVPDCIFQFWDGHTSHGFKLRESRSRTQIAYANRSCVRDFQWRISADFSKIAYAKSRTQIASRTQNRVELGAIYVRDSRFAYAIFAGILLSVICVH